MLTDCPYGAVFYSVFSRCFSIGNKYLSILRLLKWSCCCWNGPLLLGTFPQPSARPHCSRNGPTTIRNGPFAVVTASVQFLKNRGQAGARFWNWDWCSPPPGTWGPGSCSCCLGGHLFSRVLVAVQTAALGGQDPGPWWMLLGTGTYQVPGTGTLYFRGLRQKGRIYRKNYRSGFIPGIFLRLNFCVYMYRSENLLFLRYVAKKQVMKQDSSCRFVLWVTGKAGKVRENVVFSYKIRNNIRSPSACLFYHSFA